MLHDGSDSEDSFTDDGEGEEGEGRRGAGAEGRGGDERGGGEEEKSDTIPVYVPLSLEAPTITSSGGMEEGRMEKAGGEGAEGEKETATSEEKGDPEMAPVYLKKMLPVMADLFHSSLAPTLRLLLTNRSTLLCTCVCEIIAEFKRPRYSISSGARTLLQVPSLDK